MTHLFTAEHAIDLWIAGFWGTAFVIQGPLQKRFAETTSWAFVGGWQREIAIFDFTFGLLLFLHRRSGRPTEETILFPLALMSLLLGANHLASALRSGRGGHWVGAAANALAIAFATTAHVLSH
jgi:hypothetical protein